MVSHKIKTRAAARAQAVSLAVLVRAPVALLVVPVDQALQVAPVVAQALRAARLLLAVLRPLVAHAPMAPRPALAVAPCPRVAPVPRRLNAPSAAVSAPASRVSKTMAA